MKSENQIIIGPAGPSMNLPVEDTFQRDIEVSKPTPPLKKVHMWLRGRYLWVALLATVGAVAGAMWGFNRREPLYESTGQVQMEPVIPRVLFATEETGQMPMYDRFLNTQLNIMKSELVVYGAWKRWRESAGVNASYGEFNSNLEITNKPNSDLIGVSFQDPNPKVAQAAVDSFITVYLEVYKNREKSEDEQRREYLAERQIKKYNTFRTLQKELNELKEDYGTAAMDDSLKTQIEAIRPREALLRNAELMVVMGEAQSSTKKYDSVSRLHTAEEIADVDGRMAQLLEDRRKVEQYLRQLIHYKDNHPEVINAKKRLAAKDQDILAYVDEFQKSHSTAMKSPPEFEKAIPAFMTLEEWRAMYNRLKEMVESDRAKLELAGRGNRLIMAKKKEVDEAESEYRETRNRLEALNVESSVGGHVRPFVFNTQPPSYGQEPQGISKDPRIKWSVIGGVGGATLGLMAVMMVGIIDRRFRQLDDVQQAIQKIPVLGILPRLPSKFTEPEEAAVAVHCIHQLRNRLQIHTGADGPRVIAITSPSSGDGKTSLSLALAMSFAGSGVKTLLIDFDLTGGGLTSRIDPLIRRRLGELLIDRNVISHEQLNEALEVSQQTSTRLGDILVKSGYLSRRMLAEALAEQGAVTGVFDAVNGMPIHHATRKSRMPNLTILHRGAADGLHAGRISAGAVSKLLREARAHYDVVIVDTGPTPGSLESSLVAPQADAVVITVARGTQQYLVHKAIGHLTSLKARIAGVVFNRAMIRDVQTYSHTSKRTSVSLPRIIPIPKDGRRVEEASKFGPIASAVVLSEEASKTTHFEGPASQPVPGDAGPGKIPPTA